MAAELHVAHSELLLGGQRSGKSRRAEALAQAWLARSPDHRAVLVATARAWDEEMAQRIARHQEDRRRRVPRMRTVEEPLDLAGTLRAHSRPDTLVVVDCLTLWLTNLRMPAGGAPAPDAAAAAQAIDALLAALDPLPGPVVLVGNEIGLGVIPMGAETRAFVDALGWLNQQVASRCVRVSLMVAGLPLVVKDGT